MSSGLAAAGMSVWCGGGGRGEGGGGVQSGCIQFQAAKQMALEIKDYTADF